MNQRKRYQIGATGDDKWDQVAAGVLEHMAYGVGDEEAAQAARRSSNSDDGAHGKSGKHIGGQGEEIGGEGLVRGGGNADEGNRNPGIMGSDGVQARA